MNASTLPARFPRLDGLRGIAIMMVLAHQFDVIATESLLSKFFGYGLDRGWVGVQLFFVLSGFLITGILMDSRTHPRPLRDFFIRRVLRIFPLYYGALVLFAVLLPWIGAAPTAWSEHTLMYWLYLANWVIPYEPSSLPHFWSLCVEEQFYVLWPLLALRLPPRPLFLACLWVAAGSLALRVGMRLVSVDPEAVYMSSFSRVEALAAGAAVAAWLRLPGSLDRSFEARGTILAAAVAVAVAGFVATRMYERTTLLGQTVGYAALSATFALLVLLLVIEDARGARGRFHWSMHPFLRRIGLYSYGMYVFHKPLQDLLYKPAMRAIGYQAEMPLGPGLAYLIAAFGMTFVAGAVSYHLYESRFLALRSRLAPQPARDALE